MGDKMLPRNSGMLFGWLFLLSIAWLGMASPAYCGLIDQLTDSVTGPDAVVKKCREGNASLCTSAGNMYRQGYKVTKDIDKAIGFYRSGCSGGDTKSCYALYQIGFADSRGKRTKVNMPRAVQLFTAACRGSMSGKYSGPACHELAKLYLKGKSFQKDIHRGVELLKRGCDRFSRRACRALGDILLEGRIVAKNLPGAVDAYSKACEGKKKERKACAQLGYLFRKGEGVKRDLPAAEKYLTEACTFPDRIGTACYELARLYDTDLAGKKTDKEIYELYRISCDRAESERIGAACIAAAERHLTGTGAPKDSNAVIHLYNRGCMLRDPESCRLSCEWNCKRGQPYACAAVKARRYPLGASNCFKP